MNSRTDAVNNMNPVETSSAVPKPVKYIVFKNQMNMDKTIEKTSMVMEALRAYSSRNDVDIMPANSSIKNGKIMCLSTSKSQNLFESTSTAQNFNPVFSNSSSFKVNDSWVRLQNTFDFTEPHPVAISYPITNNKSIKWNPKPSDQSKKIFLPNTAEPNLVGHPNMINLSIQKKNKPSCHKIRFVKRNELPKDQSTKILLPNTAEPYPVGPPFMNEKSLKENPKSSDKNLSLLQGHGSVNKQSLMVTSLNDISCYPQLKLRDGQPGLQNSVLLHPVPNQYAQKNLNEQSEANLQGLHSVATVMNHNDPIVFAEFKKHFTLSTKNKMFRNELLASTKAANFDKTAMDTILFNLVNACEKHVFDQNVHMHVIKNIACEIAEIPGYKKHADKIRSQCHHILAETFNDMNGLVDQCVKLKNLQTKLDSDKTTSKTEPIPEINNILFPSDHFKPKLIGETGYIKIEPEDSENDVDMPVADENVEEENQMEFSTLVKPIYNKEIEKIVNEDRDQIESGNEDRDQIESGNEDRDQIESGNEDRDQIESGNEERDQIESGNEERDQIKSENEDFDQIESGNEDRDQMKSENEDHDQVESRNEDHDQIKSENEDLDQIESRNEDRDQIESGNVDGCEIKSIYEDYRQKELENEDGGQPKTIYEDYVQIEWKNEGGGKIESEMEEEEYIDNNIESVYSENRTEQINTLNFNEHSVEAQPDAAEGYSDKISENENESSELEENETEFIDENDPDWQPSQHFESSGTAKRSREPKKPKVPKKSKERKMPQAKGGICNTCGKKVKYLKEHLVTHMTERPEKCLYCDYRAKCPKSLRLHIAVHRSERNFQCEKCGLLFPRLAGVKFHLETVHSEELPFSCQFCQKKYKRKFALNLHEKIHKKQFAFTCNVCGKKFIQSGNLKTHMRTHTGEKPYKCDKCGEGFAHNVTKKLHRKTCFVEKVREKSDQD